MNVCTVSADPRVVERVNRVLTNLSRTEYSSLVRNLKPRMEQTGRAAMSKEVTARYYLSAAQVKAYSPGPYASVTPTGIYIRFCGNVIPLDCYSLRYTAGGKISVAVKRGVSPTVFSRAFITEFKSGHMGTFERSGKERLPIQEIFGPSIPGILHNEELQQPIGEKMLETFEKRVEHEISRIINAR